MLVARGRGFGGLSVKGEEREKCRLVVTNCCGDVKYSIWTPVNNIIVTTYGARLALEIPGEHLVKYMIIYPQCCTPATNTK